MATGSTWVPPTENSVEALLHGMSHVDGVELDLRLSTDGELMLWHDELFTGNLPKKSRCPELMESQEIREMGVDSFDDLLQCKEFTTLWQSSSKTVNIELKVPHPVAKIPDHANHLAKMICKIDSSLLELDLPKRSTMIYGFSPKISQAVKISQTKIPNTQLSPHLRSWGKGKMKRLIGSPNFISNTVSGLVKDRRRKGMPVVGMALHYLHGWERFVHPGAPVSLTGKGLNRLFSISQEMGLHVWPAPLKLETIMLEAGITLISDFIDPTIHSLPNGDVRWPRPASQPLDEEWKNRLNNADESERPDLILEATNSLPMWDELNENMRRNAIISDAKKWKWQGPNESWTTDLQEGRPWGCARIIGHRGSGENH